MNTLKKWKAMSGWRRLLVVAGTVAFWILVEVASAALALWLRAHGYAWL